MNSKFYLKKISNHRVTFLLAFVLLILAWDLFPLFKLSFEMKAPETLRYLTVRVENIEHDALALESCKVVAGDRKQRECLINALASIKSVPGLVMLSVPVSAQLQKNPFDDELREASLSAVDKGWLLLRDEKTLFEQQDHFHSLLNHSVLYRAAQGTWQLETEFRSYAKMLDSTEQLFVDPQLLIKQRRRYIDYYSTAR